MSLEEIRETISKKLDYILESLTDVEYKDISFYIARHRMKYYIEKNSSIDAHLKKQLFSDVIEQNNKAFSQYLDNNSTLGRNLISELKNFSTSTISIDYIKEWKERKKNYEEVKESSFFIEIDNIKPIEKIFLYSILKNEKVQKLKNLCIRRGIFMDFNELLNEKISNCFIDKTIVLELKKESITKDFLYQFQHFFAQTESINPYYDYKISSNNEIESKYIGKITDAIRDKIFEYAKKNTINISNKNKDIENIIEHFKTSYEKDMNSYKKIVNKCLVDNLYKAIPSDLTSNNYAEYIQKLSDNYEKTIIELKNKHPDSLGYSEIEYINSNKKINIQSIKTYIKKTKGLSIKNNTTFTP